MVRGELRNNMVRDKATTQEAVGVEVLTVHQLFECVCVYLLNYT